MNFKEMIPVSYTINSIDFNSIIKEELSEGSFARTGITDCVIEFCKVRQGIEVNDQQYLNSALHEALHNILDMHGLFELSRNEQMINTLAAGLTDLLRTAKWMSVKSFKNPIV